MLKFTCLSVISAGLAVAQTAPVIQTVVNGASFDNRLAPGVLASLLGSNLAGTPGPVSATSAPLPTLLAGISVLVNGKPGALLLVSPDQINLQFPVDIAAGAATVQVTRMVGSDTLRSALFNVTLDTYAPGLFTQGAGLGIFFLGGRLIGPCSTARAGDLVTANAVGLGPTDPPVATGARQPDARTVVTPKVTIGGLDAQLVFSGLAPNSAGGLYQVEFRVPQEIPAGDHLVVVEVEGRKSQAGVMLPVGPPTRPGITLAATAARADATISSGSWMSIYGCNLAPTTRIWRDAEITGGKLPTSLDGVSVKVNGKDAAVYFISPIQVNAQTPTDSADGRVTVEITSPAGRATAIVTMRRFSPASFLFAPDNSRYLAAVHADGTYVGKPGLFGDAATSRSPKPGDTILLFGTGFGPTSPAVPAGEVFTGAAPLADFRQLAIRIGNVPAEMQFAGLTGAGLYQFNVTVPSVAPGDQLVVATVSGSSTQANKYITIGPP